MKTKLTFFALAAFVRPLFLARSVVSAENATQNLSCIDQFSDDGGPTADRVNGFSGHVFGIGPIITYSTKLGKSHLDMNARFIPEFGNEKQIEGNLFQFGASLKF